MKNPESFNKTPWPESGPNTWPITTDPNSGEVIDMPFSNIASLLENHFEQYEAIQHGDGVAVKRKSNGEVIYYTDTPKQMEFLLNYSIEK